MSMSASSDASVRGIGAGSAVQAAFQALFEPAVSLLLAGPREMTMRDIVGDEMVEVAGVEPACP